MTTETMEKPETSEAWNGLLAITSKHGLRILIESGGTLLAALVPIADLQRPRVMEAKSEDEYSVLDDVCRPFDDGSPDELEREIARALESMRSNAGGST